MDWTPDTMRIIVQKFHGFNELIQFTDFYHAFIWRSTCKCIKLLTGYISTGSLHGSPSDFTFSRPGRTTFRLIVVPPPHGEFNLSSYPPCC